MKIRQGFVSNSSSSSFTCDISGRVESGMDMGMEDAEMYECVNCHMVSDEFVKGVDEQSKQGREACAELLAGCGEDAVADFHSLIDEEGYEVDEAFTEVANEWDFRGCLPTFMCPMCTLEYIDDSSILAYLLKRMGRSAETVMQEIREQFKDYPALMEFLKNEG